MKIRSLSHVIKTLQTSPGTQRVLEQIHGAGGLGVLVGGCVRDAFLGETPKDIDIEVHGIPLDALCDALKKEFRLDLVGASFGVIKLHGYDIDIALPRRESKEGYGHRGFNILMDQGLDYKDAAARRDLTINAIMLNPLNGELIDPWHGVDDLQAGILRHVSEHFTEDPLRVLRVMQFAARFPEATVAPETIALCRSITPEGLARERLAGEWEKLLLKGEKPSLGLRFLADCGWIQYYPELQALIGCNQTPVWHPEGDVWEHTCLAVDFAAERRSGIVADDLPFMVAVLCHDLGKPPTTRVDPSGKITSKGHDMAGIPLTTTFIRRLWNNVALETLAVNLVAYHMRVGALAESCTDRGVRRLAADIGRIDLLVKVAQCDMLASTPTRMDALQRLLDKANALRVANEKPRPIIQGRHLLERGYAPGPAVGDIVRQCYEKQLDGEFTDLQGGLAYLEQLLRGNNDA